MEILVEPGINFMTLARWYYVKKYIQHVMREGNKWANVFGSMHLPVCLLYVCLQNNSNSNGENSQQLHKEQMI